jgi:hypothetical protein
MTTDGPSGCGCSSQNLRTHAPHAGGAGHTDSQREYISRSPRMSQAVKSGACSGCSTQRARVGSQSSFARCSRANGRSCRSASMDWVVSAPRRLTTLAKLARELAPARAVPLTA